jgi:hypothetical protein
VDIDAMAAIAFDENRGRRDRGEALKALGRSGVAAAVAPLTLALEDHKLAVVAATALGALGERDAVPALIETLTGSGDKVARFAAAGALGKIADPAAAEALRRAARSDRDSSVRSNANKALRKLEIGASAVASVRPQNREVQQLAAEGRKRGTFNVPFVLGGLAIAGAISYWADSESFGPTLAVLVVAALAVVGFNLVQGWLKNR